jgi:hypothetical protein
VFPVRSADADYGPSGFTATSPAYGEDATLTWSYRDGAVIWMW